MSTIQSLYAPVSQQPRPNSVIEGKGSEHSAIVLRRGIPDGSFFWAMQLLSRQRREAIYGLYNFYRELEDIADGDASRSLKQTLLNWRSEIAQLYAGRPRHSVTLGLNEAIQLYGLRCEDFLTIIDGVEMDGRADIQAPSLVQLDHYCERRAVAVSRLSMRIFGEETPAGERVAAELGRALQLTYILHNLVEDAKRHRLYLPRELLHAHGIFATAPSWVLAQPTLPEVCHDLALLAERHYVAAAEAIAACSRRTMRPAAVLHGLHRALHEELVARGWRRLDEPVRIPDWRKLALVIRHGLSGR
jgi:presqualene diphosphate synthase